MCMLWCKYRAYTNMVTATDIRTYLSIDVNSFSLGCRDSRQTYVCTNMLTQTTYTPVVDFITDFVQHIHCRHIDCTYVESHYMHLTYYRMYLQILNLPLQL